MRKILFISFLFLSFIATSQSDCEKYNDKYIPIDLSDTISFFQCKWTKDDLDGFKDKKEQVAISELHFGTGMSIRNNWKLWKGTSKISKYFRNLGIHHPDDMSGIILTSLHRKLNEKPIDLKAQIKHYHNYWEELKKKQKERQENEFNEFRVGDKVEFSYEYDFISEEQEEKWLNNKCYATGIIIALNPEKLELRVKLKKSCDRKGIIILKYDFWDTIDGEYLKIEEDKIEIMKKGDIRWTSYELWNTIER